MLAKPERPTLIRTWPGKPVTYPEYSVADLRQHLAEAETGPDYLPTDSSVVERRSRLAGMEAYEAECTRLQRRFRVEPAGRVAKRAEARLREAATSLAAMRPATMAGLLAKARASAAVPVDDEQSGCPWAEDLAGAVVRELVTIGCVA